jgi:hypothetical protein
VNRRRLAQPRDLLTRGEKPKTARCAGCRLEHPRREMVYLHDAGVGARAGIRGVRKCVATPAAKIPASEIYRPFSKIVYP